MNSESDDQLDRVKTEIRAAAASARERAPLPERSAVIADAPPASAPLSSSIAELARHAGAAFVVNAYRTILRRDPDAEGFARQMAALGAGANKIAILGDLRYSVEGRLGGVPVPGLLPRYALAKLANVPVLGIPLRWALAAAALPHLLRHQRASEAQLAARFADIERMHAEFDRAHAEHRGAIESTRGDLASAVTELSDRLTRVETASHQLRHGIEHLDASVAELRQLALTMNHWTVSVRNAIDAIEASEAERRERNDETAAAMIRDAHARDADRATRLFGDADALARRVPAGATVVDLCGGPDWLVALASRGVRVSAIETNAALHRALREQSLDATLGEPSILLARIEDRSVDALTICSPERIAAEMSWTALLGEAHRIVKSGGSLMIGTPADAGGAIPAPATLAAIGFMPGDAPAGNALFATRP